MSDFRDLKAHYDVVVIGGGVHGAAVALEATRLGWHVLLVERGDFCAATSANSLRIIHGGLRYLQSADLRRSRESAREQLALLDSVPHLVKPLTCLMATDRSLSRGRLAMGLALWFYDNVVCMGLKNRPRGGVLSAAEADRLVDMNAFDRASGAALWHDAQVVDSERLVLTYLKSAECAGAHIRNYTAATDVTPGGGPTVTIRDVFTGESHAVRAGVVIDTAGFIEPHGAWTRAVNLVLDRPFPDCALGMKLAGRTGEADRLLFATPLAGRTLIGTWYFADQPERPAEPASSEVEQCFSDVRTLLPGLGADDDDVCRVHFGRLPVRDASKPLSLLEKPVIRALSDDHRLISVTGVKYTTARPTARKALRRAGLSGGREPRSTSPWYGAHTAPEAAERALRGRFAQGDGAGADEPLVGRLYRQYGSVAAAVMETARGMPDGFERIPACDGIRAEIDYCIEHEHCRTLADFVLRRSGIGSLGRPAEGTLEYCAAVMAGRLGWNAARVRSEIEAVNASYGRPDAAR